MISHAANHHASAAAALRGPAIAPGLGAGGDTTHQKLVGQAQKWVSQTFFGTLLKHMHESPFRSKMFDGGRGGETFHAMLDQRLADHMARASGSKLVNSIVRRIEATAAYKKTGGMPRRPAAAVTPVKGQPNPLFAPRPSAGSRPSR